METASRCSSTLVEAYEDQHYPLPPDPVEAILYFMENNGLDRKELEKYIGPGGRVAEGLESQTSTDTGDDPPAELRVRNTCGDINPKPFERTASRLNPLSATASIPADCWMGSANTGTRANTPP